MKKKISLKKQQEIDNYLSAKIVVGDTIRIKDGGKNKNYSVVAIISDDIIK